MAMVVTAMADPAAAAPLPLRADGYLTCPACERRQPEWVYKRKRRPANPHYVAQTTDVYVCRACRFEFALRGE